MGSHTLAGSQGTSTSGLGLRVRAVVRGRAPRVVGESRGLGSWARISHRVLDESCRQSPLVVVEHDEAAVSQLLRVIESALVVAGSEKGCG